MADRVRAVGPRWASKEGVDGEGVRGERNWQGGCTVRQGCWGGTVREAMVSSPRTGYAGEGVAVAEVFCRGVTVNILSSFSHTFLLPFSSFRGRYTWGFGWFGHLDLVARDLAGTPWASRSCWRHQSCASPGEVRR